MAIPNVNQITATLRMMGDQQLQQYATMHKNDPYILPMAIAESNARKQMRTAQSMGQQPQQKVADASIAAMLPETQGIGALPAQNMERMADGGIAGYAGDDNLSLVDSNTPVVRMSGGGIPRYNQQGLVRLPNESFADYRRRVFDAELQAEKDRNASEFAAREAERSRLVAGRGENGVIPPSPFFDRTPLAVSGEIPAANPATASAAAPAAAPIVPYGQTKIPLTQGNPPPAPPPAPAAQQGLGSILSAGKVISPEKAKEQAGLFSDFGEARTALKQAEADQETQGARMRTALSEGLPATPVMQGFAKMLDEQESKTGGEKEKAAGLALLTAGLAVAGGSSKYALQNLKEAIPAVTQYSEALKDFKKMERENMKLRGDIEVAQRAESTNNLKLKLDVEDKINSRRDKINELGIQLTSKIGDVDTRTAADIWKTSYEGVNRKETAGLAALAGSQAQLNMFERLGSADPNSALRKGFSLTKQEASEPRLYSEYIKMENDPVNGTAFKQKYPTFEVFKEGYVSSGMQFVPPPANAPILRSPKG